MITSKRSPNRDRKKSPSRDRRKSPNRDRRKSPSRDPNKSTSKKRQRARKSSQSNTPTKSKHKKTKSSKLNIKTQNNTNKKKPKKKPRKTKSITDSDKNSNHDKKRLSLVEPVPILQPLNVENMISSPKQNQQKEDPLLATHPNNRYLRSYSDGNLSSMDGLGIKMLDPWERMKQSQNSGNNFILTLDDLNSPDDEDELNNLINIMNETSNINTNINTGNDEFDVDDSNDIIKSRKKRLETVDSGKVSPVGKNEMLESNRLNYELTNTKKITKLEQKLGIGVNITETKKPHKVKPIDDLKPISTNMKPKKKHKNNPRYNPTTPPVNMPKNFIVSVTPTFDLDNHSPMKNNNTNTRDRSVSEVTHLNTVNKQKKTMITANNNSLFPILKKQKSREQMVFETYITNSPTPKTKNALLIIDNSDQIDIEKGISPISNQLLSGNMELLQQNSSDEDDDDSENNQNDNNKNKEKEDSEEIIISDSEEDDDDDDDDLGLNVTSNKKRKPKNIKKESVSITTTGETTEDEEFVLEDKEIIITSFNNKDITTSTILDSIN